MENKKPDSSKEQVEVINCPNCARGKYCKENESIVSQPKEDWIQDFDLLLKDFADNIYYEGDPMRTKGTNEVKLKSFITKLLAQQREEIIGDWESFAKRNQEIGRQSVLKEIEEKLPKEMSDEYNEFQQGFNQCRSEVLEVLNKLK